MTDKKDEPKILHKLKTSRLHMGESRIRWWFAEIEEGTPYEALFEPAFWDVHGFKFAPGDMIDAVPDEGNYRAWLSVIGTGAGGVRVAEFFKKEWKAIAAPATLASQYRVRYAGPHHKWRVERVNDNTITQAGFENESAANSWLADNLNNLTRHKAA